MTRRRDNEILTPREWEVLALIREGLSNEQIAARLGISVDGAKFHVSEILSRLGVRDRLEAARWRPEEERRLWALLLLAKRPSWLSPIVAAGLGVATAVGVGLLVWGLVVTSANEKQQDPDARFTPGGAGQSSFITFRLSGGDLAHPIIVSEVEYTLATDALDSAYAWYAKTGLPEPPAALTRFQVEQVTVRDGAVVPSPSKPDLFVPGEPALITDGTGWAQPSAALQGLLNRYIRLGRQNMLPERPTFAESLTASRAAMTTLVSLDKQELTGQQADDLLSSLGDTRAVIFGVRGERIGQRDLGRVEVRVTLGSDELVFTYVRPGAVAGYGLLFHPRLVANWELSTQLNPPGYAQRAYDAPPRLDELLATLGFAGSKPTGIVETRLIARSEAQRDCCAIDHMEVWRNGETHRVLRDVPRDVFQAEDAQQPVEPYVGEPANVEVWYKGVDPFPEAVKPGTYLYYSKDATQSGHSVLVPVKPASVANGTLGRSNGPPFYASATLDGLLRTASP